MAQGGEAESWQTDPEAAHAEAVRRIRALTAAGGDTLDFSDLPAMEALPEELAEATTLRLITNKSLNALMYVGVKQRLRNVDALSSLVGLQHLALAGSAITSLPHLSSLKSLATLDLSHTRITAPPVLSGLTALTTLDLSVTQITEPPDLSGLAALTMLNLSDTGITDLGFLLSAPRFAAEDGKHLGFADTPAADPDRDRRLYMLSRLDPKRCAVETVQYLKGTHPDFRDPPGGGLRPPLAQALAAAGPVVLDLREGQLVATDSGTPERIAPQELDQRIKAMRDHVADLIDQAQRSQVPPDMRTRLQRIAAALGPNPPLSFMLDGPMSVLRGGLRDGYVTDALDGGFVEGWRELVQMHDALMPLLRAADADPVDIPPLRNDVTPQEVTEVGRDIVEVLTAPEVRDNVDPSVVAAVEAGQDYALAAQQRTEDRPRRLRQAAIAIGGTVAALITGNIAIGKVAEAGLRVQAWLQSPHGRWVSEKISGIWDRVRRLFDDGTDA